MRIHINKPVMLVTNSKYAMPTVTVATFKIKGQRFIILKENVRNKVFKGRLVPVLHRNGNGI
jgi:hypothetical protein